MNAKKVKALSKLLRKQHIDIDQRIYIKRNIHTVREYGVDSKGEKFVLSATEAHTSYLSPACGRKIYLQLKKRA